MPQENSSNDARLSQGLNNIRFVLVGTTHPGNIGASARAMKAMGLNQLVLVAPRSFPSADATAMAAGADDLLVNANVVESLDEAIAECQLVIGTTARARHLQWPAIDPHAAARMAVEASAQQSIAIVFGRERSGLSNEELDKCHYAIRIPTDSDFSSLNLAQAVQVCAYEIRRCIAAEITLDHTPIDNDDSLANAAQVQRLHDHLIATMTAVDYFDPSNPRLLERRIRRLLNRAQLRDSEAQILRGFLSAVDRRI